MKIKTNRAETFSDGVISIIITVMVLSLKFPDIDKDNTEREIYKYLRDLVPYFVTYTFSFMMIGIFWTNHHHMFHMLEKIDEHLLWQNLMFLFWVSLIPLVTAMMGANPLLPVSCAAYGLIMLLTSLSIAIMRVYTAKKELVHKDQNRELNKKINIITVKAKTKSYLGTLFYFLSVPLAFVSVYLSYICFVIPPIVFFIPDGIDDEKLAEQIAEKNA